MAKINTQLFTFLYHVRIFVYLHVFRKKLLTKTGKVVSFG